MSADVLRRAAALMRERARVATQGPWDVWGSDSGQLEIFVPNGTMSTIGVLEFKDYLDCEECARPSTADAAHIASWGPLVALAVADWLDAEADEQEVLGSPDEPNVTPAGTLAYSVARAYLGDDDPQPAPGPD